MDLEHHHWISSVSSSQQMNAKLFVEPLQQYLEGFNVGFNVLTVLSIQTFNFHSGTMHYAKVVKHLKRVKKETSD